MSPLSTFCFLLGLPVLGNGVEDLIRAQDLRAHVYFLASEELEGREAGTDYARVASRYLRETLASYGVKPAGVEGTYYQSFEMGGIEKMRNVVGVVEGTDPKLKEEYLVIGAHYDHLGWGSREGLSGGRKIHNGADDNASGTASVLELAEVFARFPTKRSIIFLFFTAEEKGLWGSAYYCENPSRPLEKTVAMLNLDMVGRSKDHYLFVGGVGTGAGFKDLVLEQAQETSLWLELKPGGAVPSDNVKFFEEDIPVLFFFTNIHEDYHGPGDDWWKLNYPDQELITRTIYRIARVLGNEPERRKFHEDTGKAVPEDFYMRMGKVIRKLAKDRINRAHSDN